MYTKLAALVACLALIATAPTAAAQPPAGDSATWIVVLEPGSDADATALARLSGGTAGRAFTNVLGGFVFRGSATAAARLEANPAVAAVVADGTVQLTDQAGMGIFRIDAHLSQSTTHGAYRGAGTRIAVIDSGIDTDHPDLAPNIDLANAQNCDTDSTTIEDQNGHGTHVTGIAAAARNDIGVAGVAPEATILPLKAFDATGFASDSEILCAIDHLAGVVAADSVPTVLNMSFVDTGADSVCDDGDATDVMHEAICDLADLGVIMVAGAGNSAVDISNQVPARWDEVIAVSSLSDFDGVPGGAAGCFTDFFEFGFECDDTFTGFSNHGTAIDVIAPGVRIYSTVVGGWDTKSGTSMAAPHVAGVAALMLGADPTLTQAEIRALLRSTGECPDGSVSGADAPCSAGAWSGDPDGTAEPLVNALRAAQAADSGGPVETPPTAAFSVSCVDLTCSFTDASTDDGSIVSHAWAFGDGATSSATSPSHTYAAAGTYTVTLTVTDDEGLTDTTTDTAAPTDPDPTNLAPTADAGPDQVVPDTRKKGVEDVTLDGSGSGDADGTVVDWVWTLDGVTIAGGATPTVELTVGTHDLTLIVTDDDGASDADVVSITVGTDGGGGDNQAPLADAGPDTIVTDDDLDGAAAVVLDAALSTDPDGVIVDWSWSVAGSTIATGETATATLPLGRHVVTLTVTDDQGATDTDDVLITVDAPRVWTSHVHDLDVSTESVRGGWVATLSVLVVFSELEALGQVLGADPTYVTVTTSEGQELTCVTNASPDQSTDGRCSVAASLKNRDQSITFTVTDVWTPGFAYDPGANHDDDGDTDGTAATASRP